MGAPIFSRRPVARLNRGRVAAKGGVAVAAVFAINDPANLADVVSGVPITISGTSPGVAAVSVTGNAVAIGSSPVVGNNWSVPWTPGAVGAVALVATDGALSANISVNVISAVAFAFTNPANLASVPTGTPITVSGTSPGVASVTVTANAVPIGTAPVVAGAWSFSWTPTVAGATTLAATDGTLNTNISITVTSAAPSTPATIVTSQTMILWVRGDLGITEAGGPGTGVTKWDDQSGNARHANTTSGLPVVSVGPNGTAAVLFDGIDDLMAFTWNPPPPGTTPIFIWAIIEAVTQTTSDIIFGGQSASTLALIQLASAGQCRLANPTNGPTNSSFAVGLAKRLEAFFNNATTDYLKIGGTAAATGVALGNTDATGFAIGGRLTLAFSNIRVMEMAIWAGLPTELAALDAYVTSRYGAGLV